MNVARTVTPKATCSPCLCILTSIPPKTGTASASVSATAAAITNWMTNTPTPVFNGGFHDPAFWHDKAIQETDFPVTVQWSLRSPYGWTDWSPATVVEFQPPDLPEPPFETELSFDWQEAPAQ